jgi:DNA-directed DNA polymerase III PolC
MYLNCHTGFSFKYGTLPVQALFDEAKRCGVRKLILTDIHNTGAYMEMLRICQKNKNGGDGLTQFGGEAYDLDIGVGIEFRRGHELAYVAIAKDNSGFEELTRFQSYLNREVKEVTSQAPRFENVFIIYPFEKAEVEKLQQNEFIGVARHQLNTYALLKEQAVKTEKFVILHPVTFLPPEKNENGKWVNKDFNAHRLLRAIANNTLLSKLHPEQQARDDEYMLPIETVCQQFGRHPELIRNTDDLISQCSIACNPVEDKNKKFYTGTIKEDLHLLRDETLKGYQNIYGDDRTIWNERVEKELAIIARKEFTSYYLITYDLINFAKSKGYEFVGRGSGANSTVAYCLGITNVDPIELDLYFERFLNEERTTPPDFDIDFSWDNRDAIYDYLFQKYGYEHVCLLGTHVTYQWNSILRELAKVFGLPKDEINELVESPSQHSERDHITSLVFKYASYIVDKQLPSNFSIHAGGVLITERPIYCYTATELPQKGYPVSQFEMHNAEDFGIYKFDILSQRGLGHIKETVKHVLRNKGIAVNVNQFRKFKEDEKVKQLLRNSRAMGCFYVESPAMRMLLAKLQCEDYLTLVAASSIIRPGVASSGMMRTYIERYHTVKNGGSYDVIHPKMNELMRETYGVMVYQEDVIKVAHHFAGLTLTEADVLRRGMSGKYRSREEFNRVKERFFEECRKKNYEPHITNRVWYEIESFSGYSFAKGHSASYAVESYQSLYLKAHYPLEFMVGVINNFGGFYKTEFYFHEARMNGANICPPCVNNSDHLTTIYGHNIYMGFVHIKSFETKLGHQIEKERITNGKFLTLDNFLKRIEIGLEQLRILIRIGAFRFTGKSKQRLLWEAMLFFSNKKQQSKAVQLFDTEPKEYPLPALTRNEVEDAYDEIELIGFPLSDPFKLLQNQGKEGENAGELMQKVGKVVHIIGYVVTTKDARTKNSEVMHFGTFLDRDGKVFDTTHFPQIAKKFPFRGRGFYSIRGKVTEDFGVAMVEVSAMEKLPMQNKRAEEFMREFIHKNSDSMAIS